MVDPVGAAIGGASLLIQLLDGAVKGREMFQAKRIVDTNFDGAQGMATSSLRGTCQRNVWICGQN
jgi:hypothetical protein